MTANSQRYGPKQSDSLRSPSPAASSLWPSAEGVHVKLGENWTLLRWDDLQAFLLNPANTIRRTADFLREEVTKTNGTPTKVNQPGLRK
ncbi:hypothetical protein BT69DRAFT_1291307 [Atractiella rhizophila]|nr:hypothetical protein BT69DRAFT_1291307 [Atractiella rhizophila]